MILEPNPNLQFGANTRSRSFRQFSVKNRTNQVGISAAKPPKFPSCWCFPYKLGDWARLLETSDQKRETTNARKKLLLFSSSYFLVAIPEED
jgi:hypothetical protein